MNSLAQVLNPQTWQLVSQQLLAKMISEFLYEQIVTAKPLSEKKYQIRVDDHLSYTFHAETRLFDSYYVHTHSIERHQREHSTAATSPQQFLLDIQPTIPMSTATAAHLLREYNQTLIADAHIWERKKRQTQDLIQLPYELIEGEMEGHPWITYNKGRIGFSYPDYLQYAPEQKQPVQLLWIAVHKDRAHFQAVDSVDYHSLIEKELGERQYTQFQDHLLHVGKDIHNYYWMPVHEWQWNHSIIPFFAEEIAHQQIIYLGKGEDRYLPQQSIRTLSNFSFPRKHHIKLPMRILNTLVYRGLPGERTEIAPQITQAIRDIWKQDPFLHETCRLILPGEIASMNYHHPHYQNMSGIPYQYQELLGCIWRESIHTYLEKKEKPITLAALLYVDGKGTPLVSQLVQQSGLSLDAWLDRLFAVMLPPLLHYLYRYGMAFSPHGQNTILTFQQGVPHRLAVKDFVDDVNISEHPLPELGQLSDALKQVLLAEPPEGLCQFIFTGLFICHYRYLANLLVIHHQYPEITFWKKVRNTILAYQKQFPEMEDRFQLFDLLKPKFTKLCLNRNRMIDYGYAEDDDRPHASEFGYVNNPLAQTV